MWTVNEDEKQGGAVAGVDEQADLLEAEPESVVYYFGQRPIHRNCYIHKPDNW